MSHHLGGIVLAVLWTLGLGSLPFAQRVRNWFLRRRLAKAALPPRPEPPVEPPVEPQKLPVTAESRAMRDSYAALLKNTDPVQVARDAERFAPQLVDALQRIGDLAKYDKRTQP